jgi:hypothetical protein
LRSEIPAGFDRFTPNTRSFMRPFNCFSPVIMGFSRHDPFLLVERGLYWWKRLYTGINSLILV